jgi:hypothetical protein
MVLIYAHLLLAHVQSVCLCVLRYQVHILPLVGRINVSDFLMRHMLSVTRPICKQPRSFSC